MCWNACSTIAGASPSDGSSINITLGIPIIRTSVDHGVALDIAGTSKSNTSSLDLAIKTAIRLTK